MMRAKWWKVLMAGAMSASLLAGGVVCQAAEEVTFEEEYQEAVEDAELPLEEGMDVVLFENEEILNEEVLPEDLVIDETAQEAAEEVLAESYEGLIEDPGSEDVLSDGLAADDYLTEKLEEESLILAEKLPVSFLSSQAKDLPLDAVQTVTIAEKGDYELYKFVPAESGAYVFESSNDGDPAIVLYNASGESIADNDDGGEDYDFRLEETLTANTTYYVRATSYGSDTGFTYTFKVSKLTQWLKVNDYTSTYELTTGNTGVTLQANIDANPAPTYEWYTYEYDEDDYIYTRIPDQNGPSLETGPISENTYYRLIVSNGVFSEELKFAIYYVSAIQLEYVNYVRTFTGEEVTLSVNATGSTGFNYQWSGLNQDGLTLNGVASSNSVSLTVGKSGTYHISCIVKDAAGDQNTAYMTIQAEDFRLDYEEFIDIRYGGDITLHVDAYGPEGTSFFYQWLDEDGEPINADADDQASLTIENVTENMTYDCQVRAGTITETATITVRVYNLEDVYPAGGTSEIHAVFGGPVTLGVSAEAVNQAALTYEWYEGDYDEYDVDDLTRLNVESVSSITVGPFDTEGQRTFSCVVTDEFGNSGSVVFTVSVDDGTTPPADDFYLEYTSNINIVIHGTAIMTVKPAGTYTAPVKYRWYLRPDGDFDNYLRIKDATTDTYSIDDMLEEQVYVCEATDAAGNTAEAEFHLSVDESHPHDWKAGAVTKAATCTEEGLQNYVCSVCGIAKTEKVPALGHSWGAWTTVTGATVFAAEVQTCTCTRCGAVQTRTNGVPLTPTMKINASGTLPMKVKQTAKVVKVTGLAAGDSIASVTSSNTNIVKVSQSNGTIVLKAQKKTGTAVITVKLASNLTKSFKVKVQKAAVKTKKITVASKKKQMKVREKFDLATVLTPLTTQDKLSFSTSNKKVATVKKGIITAKKKGKATITVKAGKKNVKIKITVK